MGKVAEIDHANEEGDVYFTSPDIQFYFLKPQIMVISRLYVVNQLEYMRSTRDFTD